MLIIPKGRDIKAARTYLGWTQQLLADKIGLSIQSMNHIETEKNNPSSENGKQLVSIFNNENIAFHEEGGFIVQATPLTIISGHNCYLKVQEDIINTMSIGRGEILYFGSDESRSSDEIIKNEVKIYNLRIATKTITKIDDNYFMGDIETYRQIHPKYLQSDDVIVIYDKKIAFGVGYGKDEYRFIVIKDKGLSSNYREYFLKLWKEGDKPTKTIATFTYKELAEKGE